MAMYTVLTKVGICTAPLPLCSSDQFILIFNSAVSTARYSFYMHLSDIVNIGLPSDATVREGNTITITCKAFGYPPPTVVWNRINGILSDRVSVSDSVSVPTGYGNVTRVSVNLTITNASREDTGVYTCSANNGIGSDSSNVIITVQCE